MKENFVPNLIKDFRYVKQNTSSFVAVIKIFLYHVGEETATADVLQKTVFLKSLQNSQENTCARVSFLIKLQSEA